MRPSGRLLMSVRPPSCVNFTKKSDMNKDSDVLIGIYAILLIVAIFFYGVPLVVFASRWDWTFWASFV